MADCFFHEGETVQLLLRWGRWARQGAVVGRITSPLGAMIKPIPREAGELDESEVLPDLSDDDALVVDSVVARLKARLPQLFAVLQKYFIFRLTKREISRSLRCSRLVVDQLLAAAIAWVDSHLEGRFLIAV